jgi:hypothetical protein
VLTYAPFREVFGLSENRTGLSENRATELDLESPAEPHTRSDVAPKQTLESGVPPRRTSGFRAAVQVAAVPPAPRTPEDLLDDAWGDDQESTLLDSQASVPRDLVEAARAIADPLGETADAPTHELRAREAETREVETVETREVATREVETREVETREVARALGETRDDASTKELPRLDDQVEDPDDFPTRLAPMALDDALRVAYPPPSNRHDLRETLPVPPPMATDPDDTAQMPSAPMLPVALPSFEASQISQISQVSHASPISQSYPGHAPLHYPTPTSMSGVPLPPANAVRFAFLRNLAQNDDPWVSNRLVFVAAISFFATLALCGFVLWLIVLFRH